MTVDRWVEKELEAAVDAYFEMFYKELSNQTYSKSEIRDKYLQNELIKRTKASFELRMCNISSCLKDSGYKHISGYKPLNNVGTRIRAIINNYIQATYIFNNTVELAENQENEEINNINELTAIKIEEAINEIDFEKDLASAREDFEKKYLQYHLKRFNGNITKTARFVGIDRSHLHRKLKQYNTSNDQGYVKTIPKKNIDDLTAKILSQSNSLRESISGRTPIVLEKEHIEDRKKKDLFFDSFKEKTNEKIDPFEI